MASQMVDAMKSVLTKLKSKLGIKVSLNVSKSDDPGARGKAVVEATTHYQNSEMVAKGSKGLKKAMKGLDMSEIPEGERLQERGW